MILALEHEKYESEDGIDLHLLSILKFQGESFKRTAQRYYFGQTAVACGRERNWTMFLLKNLYVERCVYTGRM